MPIPPTPTVAQNSFIMNISKVGVIGIGNIGFAHAQSIYNNEIDGFSLAAVCDINVNVKETVDEYLKDVRFFEKYEDLLDLADIDTVIIATPHPLHSEIAIKAFQKGKNVLVEKPIDISVSKVKLLNKEAQKSGKKFAVMFNQRTGKLFKKAKEIVDSKDLGELKRSVWLITNWYRSQRYYDSGNWRATWAGEGGGVLVNQAPHQLDIWQWICGMPISVTAFCDEGKYHNIEVEDNATIYVKFQNGADGVFITSTGEYPGTNRLEISGSKGKLVLENGVLKWWKLSKDEREYCFEKEKSDSLDYSYEEIVLEDTASGHKQILQNFANAILKGEELIAPGYEGINEVTIQNAAYLSSWKGSVPINIPFDEEEFDSILEKKQENSSFSHASNSAKRKKGYKSRWQIIW